MCVDAQWRPLPVRLGKVYHSSYHWLKLITDTTRAADEHCECPWGCGLVCAVGDMEAHKHECLMEPRKLLAAIHKLHAENERLDAENKQLRNIHPPSPNPDSRKRPALGPADEMVCDS